jgi:hypothetical protein
MGKDKNNEGMLQKASLLYGIASSL